MPLAAHVAAAIAACGPRSPAQPSQLPRASGRAGHVQAAIGAGRGGAAPVQARLSVAPVPPPAEHARGLQRPLPPVAQAMKINQVDDDLWSLPGFLFNQHQGYYLGQAPKSEIKQVGGNIPKKTYLYLGAGDLSAPALKAKKHEKDDGYQIVATELQSEQNLQQTGGNNFGKNLRTLLGLGHTVAFDVDAVQNTRGAYDRIVFQNPHTGNYGNAESFYDDADLKAISSNANLLAGLFRAARGHLEPNGFLEITICGFPYISSTWGQRQNKSWRQGLGLENKGKANNFAKEYGWQLVSLADKGNQQIRRNNGDWFTAKVYKLKFREIG